MQINFKIIDDRLALAGQYQRLVSGNTNTYVCKFENNNTDESLTWYAVFYASDGCAYRQEIQNGECYIPGAAIKAEHQFSLKIGVYGTVIAEDEVRRISTNLVLLNIVAGGYCEEAVSDVPSHDIWEEMVLKTIPLIGENGNWYIYDPEKKDYIDSGKPARGPEYVLTDEDKLSIAKTTAPILQPNIDAAAGQAKLYADSKDNELRADIEAELGTKANSSDVYTKTETDGKLDTKVDKESGKGLSANDYTNTDKAKVDNLPDDTQSELDAKANSSDLVNYVKNTDIATASELGIVKFNASFGISVNANGQPFINKAPQSVIDNRAENPSASYYPIVPSNFDYAASKSTHQDMSDNYDVSTLQVAESFEGKQGQLPVSYDASKGYIDEKFSDSTPITTASGYPLMITDHLEGEDVINYQVYGNSTQATRSGKNILPYPYSDTTKTMSGITFTDNGDGTITVSGTATDDVKFYCRSETDKITISSGTYTMSGCPNGGSATTYYIGGFSYNEFSSGQTFTVTDTTSDWFYIMIKSGTTVNNLIFKPQIEVGTTATEYEQYGVMPSPDYPSEIQSVGDLVTDETSEYYGKYDVPVTVMGKNLFDMETILPQQGWVKQDDGSYYVANNGTVRNKILWENTENYTGQLKILFQAKYSVDNTRGSYLWVNYTDGTYLVVYYAGTVVANTWYYPESSRTITDSNKIVQNIVWTYGTGATSTWVKDIIITKDLTATEYEQYSGETKHIYLDEPLRKVGDYADYVDFENQKVVRQINVRDMGELTYQYYSSDDAHPYGYFVAKPTNSTNFRLPNSKVVCEIYNSSIISFKTDKTIFSTSTSSIYIVDSDHTDGDAIKNAVTGQKIYIIRDTPSEEPITVPELSVPNSAVMNISSGTSTQPSNIYIKYYQDINKKLDEIHTNYVKFTDYATSSKAGVVKYNVAFGIGVNADGYVYTVAAPQKEIDLKTTSRKPIVPSNLDYAVRSVYPITQTALADPITVNTIYDLGLQTDIAIALPSGQLGDFIQFDFVSGTTATTLSVSSSNGIIGYDLIPEANNIYTLYFDWGVIACDTTGVQTYGWRCNYFEYAITLSEPSST